MFFQVGVIGTGAIGVEPPSVLLRSEARRSEGLLTDWKRRLIAAYDVELQDFFADLSRGKLTGPSPRDGSAAAVTADACVQAQPTGQVEKVALRPRPAFFAPAR